MVDLWTHWKVLVPDFEEKKVYCFWIRPRGPCIIIVISLQRNFPGHERYEVNNLIQYPYLSKHNRPFGLYHIYHNRLFLIMHFFPGLTSEMIPHALANEARVGEAGGVKPCVLRWWDFPTPTMSAKRNEQRRQPRWRVASSSNLVWGRGWQCMVWLASWPSATICGECHTDTSCGNIGLLFVSLFFLAWNGVKEGWICCR